MAFNLGDLIYKLSIDSDQATAELKKFNSTMKAVGTNLTAIGKDLTKNVTLPIVAAGGLALKFAADFEVSLRKFKTAYKDSIVEANKAIDTYSKSFGVSTSQATKLFAFTGDLLKGFGATSKEALSLTIQTQELASALSAYNGIPLEQTSRAITSALTGETEGMKQLGIVVKQTDIDQRILLKGQQDLTGQALLLARAQATIELAYEQSGDAVNSFAKNTDTLAFQTQALIGDLKDLAVEIGTELIPIAKDVIKAIKPMVEWFSNLDEQQKKTFLAIAGVAAVIGPFFSVAGKLVESIKTIGNALTFLAANPLAAVITALGLAIVGFKALADAEIGRQTEENAKKFTVLGTEIGLASDQYKAFGDQAIAIQTGFKAQQDANALTYTKTKVAIIQLAKEFGLTKEQIIKTALASKELNTASRTLLNNMLEEMTTADNLGDMFLKQAEAAETATIQTAEYEKQSIALATANKKLGNSITEVEQARIDAVNKRKEDTDALLTKLGGVDALINKGIITESEGLQKKIELRQEMIDLVKQEAIERGYLLSTDQINLNSQFENIGKYEARIAELSENVQGSLKAITDFETDKDLSGSERPEGSGKGPILKGRTKSVVKEDIALEKEKADAIFKINKENQERIRELDYDDIDRLVAARDEELAIAKETGASEYLIREFYEKKIAATRKELRKAENEELQKNLGDSFEAISEFVGDVSEIYRQLTEYQVEQNKTEYENKILALDEQLLGTDEYNKQKTALEKEQAMKEYDIKSKSFKTQQGLDIAETVFSTSLAAMRAYSALAGIPIVGPILGAIAAAAAIAFGAVQIANIKAQPKPVKPAFAEGALVAGRRGGLDAIIGEAGPEAVLPLNDKTLGALGNAIVGSTSGSTSRSANNSGDINIYGGGEFLMKLKNGVRELIDNRQLTIPEAIIVRA